MQFFNHFQPSVGFHFASSLGNDKEDSLFGPIVLKKCVDIIDSRLEGDSNCADQIAPMVYHILPVFKGDSDVKVSDT